MHIRVVTPACPPGRFVRTCWRRLADGDAATSSHRSRRAPRILEVNVIVRIAGGKWRWRFDLCYLEYKLIIEYDGRQHAYDAEQWSHDLNRREWLDQEGWRIVIVISDGIYGEPLRTPQRVKAALEERGARVPKSSSRSGRATSRSVPSLLPIFGVL